MLGLLGMISILILIYISRKEPEQIGTEETYQNITASWTLDKEGTQPVDEPVFADGPDAYFSALPIKAMVKAVNDAGIPASVSDTAGTFICNHVLYGVRYLCEHKYPGKKSGFIHIPFMTSQAVGKKGTPSMSLDEIVKGLTAAIEAIVLNEEDIKVTGGHEH